MNLIESFFKCLFHHHLLSTPLHPFLYLTLSFPSPFLCSKNVPPRLVFVVSLCSVVRGLLLSQEGEGHVLQMDMSCGAMPSQLGESPGVLSTVARQTLRKRGTIFGQASRQVPWAKLDAWKRRTRRERDGRRTGGESGGTVMCCWWCWQTNVISCIMKTEVVHTKL